MNHIASLAKGVVYLCDTINSIEAVSNNIKKDHWFVRAHLINQIAVLGCVFSSVYLENQPDSFDALQKEKIAECVCRFSNLFLSLGSEFIARPEQLSAARAAEKVIAGFVDLLRPMADCAANEFHHLSLLSNEELAKLPTSSPYYESSFSEPLTQELCLKYEAKHIETSADLAFIRGLCENGAIGRSVNSFPERAANAREEHPPVPRAPVQQVISPLENLRETFKKQMHEMVEKYSQDEQYAMDAEALPFIPSRFCEDALFKSNICPILHLPIRDPVQDPVTNHIYEKLALQFWVVSQGKSPQNPGQRLTLDDLIDMPLLKMLITRKLDYLLKQEEELRRSESFQRDLAKETL